MATRVKSLRCRLSGRVSMQNQRRLLVLHVASSSEYMRWSGNACKICSCIMRSISHIRIREQIARVAFFKGNIEQFRMHFF